MIIDLNNPTQPFSSLYIECEMFQNVYPYIYQLISTFFLQLNKDV